MLRIINITFILEIRPKKENISMITFRSKTRQTIQRRFIFSIQLIAIWFTKNCELKQNLALMHCPLLKIHIYCHRSEEFIMDW